eukprot:7535-Heterococcus_DN1.PRE.3
MPPALQLLEALPLLLLLLPALASHLTYEYTIASPLLLVHWSPSSVSSSGTRVTASAAAASSGAASARGGAVQLTALLFRYTPGTSAAPKRHATLPVLAYSAVLLAGTDSVTGVPPRTAPLAGCSCPTAVTAGLASAGIGALLYMAAGAAAEGAPAACSSVVLCCISADGTV